MDALRSPRCAGKFSGTGVLSMTAILSVYIHVIMNDESACYDQ